MTRSLKWRFIVTAILFCGAVVYVVPTFTGNLPDWWREYLPTDRVHLGLDLQGGIHLVLEVQEEKAVESTIERTILDLKEILH